MLPTLFNRNGNLNSLVDSFEQDLNHTWHNIVNDFFKPSNWADLKNRSRTASFPKVDVYTVDDEYTICASVPGMTADNIAIEIEEEDNGRFVKISGSMTDNFSENKPNWQLREIKRSQFMRVLPLPSNIVGDPTATIKNGFLSLVWKIPKEISKEKERKLITVKEN